MAQLKLTRRRAVAAAIGAMIPMGALAQGMGPRAVRATTAEEFDSAFAQAMAVKGPQLIEAMVVQQAP